MLALHLIIFVQTCCLLALLTTSSILTVHLHISFCWMKSSNLKPRESVRFKSGQQEVSASLSNNHLATWAMQPPNPSQGNKKDWVCTPISDVHLSLQIYKLFPSHFPSSGSKWCMKCQGEPSGETNANDSLQNVKHDSQRHSIIISAWPTQSPALQTIADVWWGKDWVCLPWGNISLFRQGQR